MFQVQWPLSIVISKKALSKYQLIFRFLFHCKHVERQLCGAWQIHQVWANIIFVALKFFLFLQNLFKLFASLTNCCEILQGIRAMNSKGTAIPRSSLLCRSMLKFISSLLHYLTFEASRELLFVLFHGIWIYLLIDFDCLSVDPVFFLL